MIRLAIIGMAFAVWPKVAFGHDISNSTVVLSVEPGAVGAQLALPLSELEPALRQNLSSITEIMAARLVLDAYLRSHVALGAPADKPWPMTVTRMSVGVGEHTSLEVTLRFAAPSGKLPTRLRLEYDVITREITGHYVLVFIRESPTLRPVGRLQSPARNLIFEITAPRN